MKLLLQFLRDWALAVATCFAALLTEPATWLFLLLCLLYRCA